MSGNSEPKELNPVNEFLSHLKERLSSPFFGPFIFSWIIFNWKFVLMLAYDKTPIMTRMELAEALYLSRFGSILIPLGFAFIYVLGSPYITGYITLFRNIAVNRFARSSLKTETERINIAKQMSAQKLEEEMAKESPSVQERHRKLITDRNVLESEKKEFESEKTKNEERIAFLQNIEQSKSAIEKEYTEICELLVAKKKELETLTEQMNEGQAHFEKMLILMASAAPSIESFLEKTPSEVKIATLKNLNQNIARYLNKMP